MADIPASTWSETDDSNNTAAPLGFPEGMAPSGINNGARAVMGAVKRWFNWTIPKTTGGTSTAYTLSYTVAPGALVDGMSHLVQFNAACGSSPTLNVNSLGAKPIYYYTGSAWAQITAAGTIPANMIARVSYNLSDGAYRITSASFPLGAALLAIANTLTGTLTMSGKAINEAAWVDVASDTTTDIGAADSNAVRITGTTAITGFGTAASGVRRKLRFADALTLTHNSTSLILQTGANITTEPDDTVDALSLGSGNWLLTGYARKSGRALSVVATQQYAQAYCTISGTTLTVQKQTGFTSVVRDSAGLYTCTLSTAMPDANYVVEVTCGSTSGSTLNRYCGEDLSTARSTTVFHIYVGGDNAGQQDSTNLNIRVYA